MTEKLSNFQIPELKVTNKGSGSSLKILIDDTEATVGSSYAWSFEKLVLC